MDTTSVSRWTTDNMARDVCGEKGNFKCRSVFWNIWQRMGLLADRKRIKTQRTDVERLASPTQLIKEL